MAEEDNKVEIKVGGSTTASEPTSGPEPSAPVASAAPSEPVSHTPGMTFHPEGASADTVPEPASTTDETPEPAAENPTPPGPQPQSAAPKEPDTSYGSLAQQPSEHVTSPPVAAGPTASHVVAHPHKQSLGKGFVRELLYLVVLLLLLVGGALVVMYLLKV